MKNSLILVSFLLLSAIASATTVFVNKVDGSGVDEASTESTFELIKSAVPQNSGYTLSENKTTVEVVLTPKLLKLGDAYILKIDKFKGSNLLFSSKMKASNLADMDTVAQRVVRAVLNESESERNAEVTDVTEAEQTQSTRRYQATRQWLFSFGPAWSAGINASKDNVLWNLGYVWGLDPDWDVKINYMMYAPSGNANFYDLSLGMNYYFSRSKNSLFAMAGFGRASAAAEKATTNFWGSSDDTASGWSLNAGAGYKFFRTSTVNFAVMLNHAYVAEKTKYSGQTPQVTALTLALFY